MHQQIRRLPLLCTIILIAFALRTIGLGDWSLWYDEGYSIILASKGIMPIITQTTAYEINTPLYIIILHGWNQLVGNSEFASRFVSVAASLITITLVTRLTQNRRVQILAAILLALSPLDISLAQEARMYGLLATFCMAALVVLDRHLHQPYSLQRVGLWALLCLLAFATHVLGAFSYIAQFFLLIGLHWRKHFYPVINRQHLGVICVPGMLIAFFLLFARASGTPYSSALPGWLSLNDMTQSGFASLILPNLKPDILKTPIAICTILILAIGLLALRRQRWIYSYAILSVMLIVILGAITGKFRARYVTLAAPILVLSVATLINLVNLRTPRVILSSMALIISVYGFFSWRTLPIYRFDDFKGAINFLTRNVAIDETVLLTEGYFHPMLEYYYVGQQGQEWHAVPLDPVLNVSHMTDYSTASHFLNQALKDKAGAWLLMPPENVNDPARTLNSLLQRQSVGFSPVANIDSFHGLKLLHYRFNEGKYQPTPESMPAFETSRIDTASRPQKGLGALGCNLPKPVHSNDQGFEVNCFWLLEPKSDIPYDTQISIRILNAKSNIIHQQDGQLAPQGLPIIGYRKSIFTVYSVQLRVSLPVGDYTFETVAYTPKGEVAPHILMPFVVKSS